MEFGGLLEEGSLPLLSEPRGGFSEPRQDEAAFAQLLEAIQRCIPGLDLKGLSRASHRMSEDIRGVGVGARVARCFFFFGGGALDQPNRPN